jgi:hypothetical protein
MKNNTNFPKPKRGYTLDAGDKKAIAKAKAEAKAKLRAGNKLSTFNPPI